MREANGEVLVRYYKSKTSIMECSCEVNQLQLSFSDRRENEWKVVRGGEEDQVI